MKSLKIGESLRLSSGERAKVQGLERNPGEFWVYNFEVQQYHNYYVTAHRSDPGVLAHNEGCDEDGTFSDHTPKGVSLGKNSPYHPDAVRERSGQIQAGVAKRNPKRKIINEPQKSSLTEKDFPSTSNQGVQRSSPGRMQGEVYRGAAPKEVLRVDGAHNPNQGGKPHVHLKDGTSANWDGTVHDAHGGYPNPSNATRNWLDGHGWTPPTRR